jgi:hypothetical protein
MISSVGGVINRSRKRIGHGSPLLLLYSSFYEYFVSVAYSREMTPLFMETLERKLGHNAATVS